MAPGLILFAAVAVCLVRESFFLDEGGLSREGVEENQASVFVLQVI